MNRLFAGVFLFFLITLSVFGQNKYAVVSGRVVESESKEPAIQANVQMLSLPDSVYVAGGATTVNGFFRLPKVKVGKYVLKVTYVGFKNRLLPLTLVADKNVGTIELKTDAVMLAEAVVTAEAPQVQVVEDTLMYSSSAYRTPKGAMLEELVRKLPGAEVDEDGKITINGKEVRKIMVNGKEFFGGDVRTGMKNLPVDMIEKLKTYDKQSDLARVTGIDDGDEETVLDLTVKKGMNKGVFGNFDLSAGTEDRYLGRGMVNYFRDDTQVSFITGANNVNDQGFSGGGGPRWRRNNGLNAKKNIGLDFALDRKKYELGGSIRYDYADNDLQSIGSVENFLPNGNSYTHSNSAKRNKTKDFNADFRLEWRPDTLTNIIFRPDFSYGTVNNLNRSESGTFNQDPFSVSHLNPNDYLAMGDKFMTEEDPYKDIRVNAINMNSLADNKSVRGNATLQVNRKLNSKGRNITLRGVFTYNDHDNQQYTESDNYYFLLTNSLGGDSVLVRNQYISSPVKTYNYKAQLTYSEPVAKATFLQFKYQFNYKYNESDKRTYNLNGYNDWGVHNHLPDGYEQNRVDSLGKYAEYRYYNHDISTSLRFVRQKWQLSAGVSFQPQHTVLSYKKGDYMIDTVRNVFNFSPSMFLRIRFSKVSQLRAIYRGYSSQPSMESLLPIVDNSNPQNIRIGNPGLKPSFNHMFRLFYSGYNNEHQRSIIAHASFMATQNSVSNSRIYNEKTGGWTTTPKNINGNWHAFGMFGINTALKNKKFTVGSFSMMRYANNVGYLTDIRTKVEQKNTTTNWMMSERLKSAYRNDWFEFGVNGSFTYTIEKDKLTSSNNQEPYTFSYGVNTQVNLPWQMALTTNIGNQSRRGYSDNSMNRNELIWNAQLSQTFLKGNATVSFEMYDILKEQSNISRSLSADGRSVYRYNGVNSYCMFHFIYRLNIFGDKKSREQMGGYRGYGGYHHSGRPGGGFGRHHF